MSYKDQDGNDISLRNLIVTEPDWAVNCITLLKEQLRHAEAELERANARTEDHERALTSEKEHSSYLEAELHGVRGKLTAVGALSELRADERDSLRAKLAALAEAAQTYRTEANDNIPVRQWLEADNRFERAIAEARKVLP